MGKLLSTGKTLDKDKLIHIIEEYPPVNAGDENWFLNTINGAIIGAVLANVSL